MTDIDNEVVVARMRQACKVKKDAELARYLDSTTSAVSSWKSTKNPPFRACFKVAQKTGASQDWLLTGNTKPSRYCDNDKVTTQTPTFDREIFVAKFVEIVKIGDRTGVFPITDNVLNIEIERLGNTLFNETIGKIDA